MPTPSCQFTSAHDCSGCRALLLPTIYTHRGDRDYTLVMFISYPFRTSSSCKKKPILRCGFIISIPSALFCLIFWAANITPHARPDCVMFIGQILIGVGTLLISTAVTAIIFLPFSFLLFKEVSFHLRACNNANASRPHLADGCSTSQTLTRSQVIADVRIRPSVCYTQDIGHMDSVYVDTKPLHRSC